MGKLTTLWKNKEQILEGIKNTILKDQYVEEVSETRMSICSDCPSRGNNCIAPGTGPCCGECGCSLKFKTRSLSSECPLNKWSAVLTQKEEDDITN